jgi:phosphate transport system protein
MTQSLRATFDREFQAVCDDLLLMSQQVGWAIEHAMYALKERDLTVAEAVIAGDDQINHLRFKIEEACITLIATQQPAASDLRAIIAVMHMVVEIERMGDHAAGIAKTVALMSQEPLAKPLKKIPKMGDLSRQMLADCIQAFFKRDTDWAREIAAQDAKMDHMYRDVFERLLKIMAKKPELIARATYLMWCAHNLERIADRVTNIAEQIIFMLTGDMSELNA